MGHRNIAKSRGETQEMPCEKRKVLEMALRVIARSNQDLEEAEITALRKAAGTRAEEGLSLRTVAIQVTADAILGEGFFAPTGAEGREDGGQPGVGAGRGTQGQDGAKK